MALSYSDWLKNNEDYSRTYLWEDFGYSLNPLNWLSPNFSENKPSEKHKREDYESYLSEQSHNDLVNFNSEFNDLFNSGASSDELLSYVLSHPDVQYDSGVIESLVNSRRALEDRQYNEEKQKEYDSRNLYAENLAKMKEAGINPLVGLGNVGSLGSADQLSFIGGSSASLNDRKMEEATSKADVGSNGYNGTLSNIKNILLILLALGRL